ncbi:MAG: flagellar biosynthesis protein FlgM, partial [Phyllobacteriaceae bacterium]|nr:flagellar biosynthesis protein FlgM [Phyllobacteriaceae bacterium]
MLWKGRRQSSNIEDRRGGGMPGGRIGGGGPIRLPVGRGAGGGGLSGIIILV